MKTERLAEGQRVPHLESAQRLPRKGAPPHVVEWGAWLTSHPLLGTPSQLEKPKEHDVSVHVPVAHVSDALGRLQLTLQPPQSVSVVKDLSQPLGLAGW